jgi:hypothetical protein
VPTTTTQIATACVEDAQSTSQASMIYPSNQATGIDPYAVFSWTSDGKAVSYALCVGTRPGTMDVWQSGETVGTSVSVPNLQPNTPYYLRLQVKFTDNTYALIDSTFTSGTGVAHFTNPTDGATDVDPLSPLAWNSVLDAEMYTISLSTSQAGGADAYNSGDLPSITNLANYDMLPNTLFYPPNSVPHSPAKDYVLCPAYHPEGRRVLIRRQHIHNR